MHLTCCLLPKANRDTMEVLFTFMNWVASFSTVDEETGSKMDVHNLATVIAPNMLFTNAKTEHAEDSFLGIEAVHQLIKYNETLSQVPSDFQSILNDTSMFSGSAEITTKEILKRYAELNGRPLHSVTSNPPGAYDANNTTTKGTMQGPKPKVGHAESTLQQANARPSTAETGVRLPPKSSQTPPPGMPSLPNIPGANGFYSNSQSGSRDSFGTNGGRYYGQHGREAHNPSPGPGEHL